MAEAEPAHAGAKNSSEIGHETQTSIPDGFSREARFRMEATGSRKAAEDRRKLGNKSEPRVW